MSIHVCFLTLTCNFIVSFTTVQELLVKSGYYTFYYIYTLIIRYTTNLTLERQTATGTSSRKLQPGVVLQEIPRLVRQDYKPADALRCPFFHT